MDKDYFIGLDVGTDSVGWATSDEDYNILRLKGKTAFGAALFEAANDAKERRTFRTAGRRLARRKFRIKVLNNLFAAYILPKDPNFFNRLEESAFVANHKTDPSFVHPLFGNELEKEFYKKYPTIWHLRAALLRDEDEAFSDIRYVYLAIHHILKYRGNFLSSDDKRIGEFDESVFDALNDGIANKLLACGAIDEADLNHCVLPKSKYSEIIKILKNSESYKGKQKKAKAIVGLFEQEHKEEIGKFIELFASIVTGGSFDLSKLGDGYDKLKVEFNGSFDENEEKIQSALNEDFVFVEVAKIVHDYLELDDILSGYGSLSDSFVSIYEAHKYQLAALKKILVTIDEKEGNTKEEERLYFKVFKKKDEPNNYPALVHVNSACKRPGLHDFNDFVWEIIEPYKERYFSQSKEFKVIESFIKNDTLCKTIAISSTSVIPHQLHAKELNTILANAVKRFPELETIREKIQKLFLFRVPYYYGPLSTSKYSHVVFKDSAKKETIYPWNISEIIDDAKTREEFMNSLTNSCTYLKGEKQVLPKQSILFQDYVNLNRLNSIRINGAQISQEVKRNVFENRICVKPKTTIAGLKKFLIDEYSVYTKDNVSISGLNENDPFDNSTRYALSKAFDCDKDAKKLERIIYLLAVYCDQKADALEAVKKEFPDLSENQMKAIGSLTIKGWAPFSSRFLSEICVFDDVGVRHTIFELLADTTMSLNEILHSKEYRFLDVIKQENDEFYSGKTKGAIVKDMIEALPPKMRRSTIQAVKIVDEIVSIAGRAPKAICVEVTREAPTQQKGSMTDSRFKELNVFLKSLAKDADATICSQSKTLQEQLQGLRTKNELSKLKGKHLYLYFKQDGIDLYTGLPMDINDVLNGNKYDWEHIVPQRLIKDDSLDNTILVAREYNQRVKGGLYPVPEEIRCNPKVRRMWDILHKKGSISDEKYNRLIRSSELSETELSNFVNAQINVVNQSNKTIKDILEFKYPETKLIFSKAAFPHYLRRRYGIPKLRDLNDVHHAVDAYLNIVAGTILHRSYGNLRVAKALEEKEEKILSYNMEKKLDDVIEKGVLEEKIVHNCYRHDALLTRRHEYSDSAFYDLNPLKKGAKDDLYPLHAGGSNPYTDVETYGGYNSVSNEYIVVCRGVVKKKKVSFLQYVPHVIAASNNTKIISEWIAASMNERFPGIESLAFDLNKRLYNGTVVETAGARYLLANSNAEQISLKPFSPVYLSKEASEYIDMVIRLESVLSEYPSSKNVLDLQEEKLRKEHVVVSKEKNAAVLRELVSVFSLPKYAYCPFAEKGIAYAQKYLDTVESTSLAEQVLAIKKCLGVLARNGLVNSKDVLGSAFRKSRGSLISDGVKVIDQSVTGLYSASWEL